jgi:diaminobutyrate-2-oxoglutarate transaminase
LENDLNQSTYFLPYFGFIDGDFSSASYLEKILDDKGSGFDKPAAIILETIQGEGGVNIAPDKWLKRIRNITKKHNILFIVDDIQVGCGRTGSFFSFEKANITPDLVTLSKSLSGYGLPMSLLLINPEIDQWEPGQHTGTFRGNNLAFVTAAAAIEKYWSDDNFSKEILEKHEILMKNLRRLKSENEDVITDVRGKGLIAGLEFNSGELAGEVSKLAFSNGLLIETCGSENNVLKFLPPLTISKEELIEGITVIENVLHEILESVEI